MTVKGWTQGKRMANQTRAVVLWCAALVAAGCTHRDTRAVPDGHSNADPDRPGHRRLDAHRRHGRGALPRRGRPAA